MNRAMELLARTPEGRGRGGAGSGATAPLRELGPHPEDGEPIVVMPGRFGPYVKHGKVNASLPKGKAPDELSVAEAVELLAGRAAKAGGGKGKPGRAGAGRKVAKAKPAAARAKPAAKTDAGKAAPKKAPVAAKAKRAQAKPAAKAGAKISKTARG